VIEIRDDRFELTEQDKATALWLRLRAHLEDRLAAARRRNDEPQPEANTATIRGEIKALKSFIALGDERPILG
jgi:hypothetical protein